MCCFLAFVSSLFTIFEFVTCHLSWGTSLAESKCHTLLFSPAGELLGLWIAVKKIAFYDLLVQLALQWRPATIVWTVCNEEGRRNKCLLLPLGLLGMHLPMLNVSEFNSKNEVICLTVCILSSEFKTHSPLGCPDNAFIFACCLVFTLQGLLTIQMNFWGRYNIICTSPCLMCHLDSLCIGMLSRTAGNLLEMAQCSYTVLSEPVVLFLVASAFI